MSALPLAIALTACVAFAAASPTAAQSYPTKPIRIVVPYAPSGGTDVIARLLAKKLSETFGQAVVVDNRSGAGGIVGTELVTHAPADGYTLLLTSSAHTIVPAMGTRTPYDPVKDFTPISLLTAQPYLMVVHSSVAASTVEEFIALAKSRNGQINYGSGGIGTAPHLAGELLQSIASVKLVHVPYKGGGPALVGVVTGEVEMLFSSLPTTLPQAQAGKVKILGISSLKRSAAAPSVPTLAEAGVPGFEVINWYGVLAPAKTTERAVTKLHDTIVRVLHAPDIAARLAADGTDVVGDSPAQFREYLEKEITKWRQVVRTTGVTAQETR